MVKEENWKDNYRFAIGASYQIDPKLVLRTGIAYDTAAVSGNNRTITIPETDRTWLSFGAGYQVTERLTLDAGIAYIFAREAKIKESRGYAMIKLKRSAVNLTVKCLVTSGWLVFKPVTVSD